jgi:hypothetical protein
MAIHRAATDMSSRMPLRVQGTERRGYRGSFPVDDEADETTGQAGDLRAGAGRADLLGGEAKHGTRGRSGSCADQHAIGHDVPPQLLRLTPPACAQHRKHRQRGHPPATLSRHVDLT